jgi:dethiobiotin synthetase
MRRGLFITGTDTSVGKTVVAAALVVRYGKAVRLRYWKPIQTGAGQDDDTAEVIRLARAGRAAVLDAGVRLPQPVSPHLAARLSGCTIDVQRLLEPLATESGRGALKESPAGDTRWIVEGAGGALVPIGETELMTDLMVRLDFPVVMVSRSTLGTINHTLLTLEALRRRSLTVAGIVMVGPRDPENRAAIEHYGNVTVIGEMPRFEPLTPDAIHAWAASELDTGERLRGALGLSSDVRRAVEGSTRRDPS